MKIDNQGRVTYEAKSFDDILNEERRRLSETWSDAARQSSAASRRSRAKGPRQKAVKRRTDVAPEQSTKQLTDRLHKNLQTTTDAQKASVAGQRKDLAGITSAKQKAAADAAKAAKASKSKGKSADAEQKKKVAAEHDARLKPMAEQLNALAAAGKKNSPEYAAKYAEYKKAQAAKAAALGKALSVPAPQKPKSTKAASVRRRVNVGAARTSKVNAFRRLRITR